MRDGGGDALEGRLSHRRAFDGARLGSDNWWSSGGERSGMIILWERRDNGRRWMVEVEVDVQVQVEREKQLEGEWEWEWVVFWGGRMGMGMGEKYRLVILRR